MLIANQAAEALTGYSHEELHALSIEALVPHAASVQHSAHRRRFMGEPAPRRPMSTSLEITLLRKDGTELPVDISLSLIELDDNDAVVAAARDVSEQRAIQRALQEHRRLLVIANERDRVANKIRANTIHRVFGIGLSLQAASLGTDDPGM